MTIREQIEWYLNRIGDQMSAEDAAEILALLNRIALRSGGKRGGKPQRNLHHLKKAGEKSPVFIF